MRVFGRCAGGEGARLAIGAVMAAAVILALVPASHAAAGWTVPQNLSAGSTTGNMYPQIALDAAGCPHVVWHGDDGATYRVYYSENAGSGWTAPQNLSPGTTANRNPCIAVDPSGSAHVVWQGNSGSTDSVFYSSDTGSGWSAPLNLSPATADNQLPQVALDAAGHPHVVWHGNDATTDRIWYSAYTGSGWSTPVSISPGVDNGYGPQLALDQTGNAHVVWRGHDGVTLRIYYASNAGGGWSAPAIVSAGAVTLNRFPELALDAAGNAHVAWQGFDTTNQAYYASNAGGGWSAPLKLSTSSISNWYPRIAVSGEGYPHVVWFGRDGLDNQAYYSSNDGGGWSVPLALSTNSITNRDPRIELDPNDHPHVVWQGNDTSTDRIYYTTDAGSGWTSPISLSSGISGSNASELAVDGGGSPQAVWSGNDGATERVWYSRDEQQAFYFAEGYTGAGFREYLCLGNPSVEDLSVKVTYLFTDGSSLVKVYLVPALSRFTVDVNAEVGADREVSVKCDSGEAFVAERPMYFDYTGGGGHWTGGSDVLGASAPSATWNFAEGYTGEGFEEFICVLNPGDAPAALTFRFQTTTGEQVRNGSVGAHTRGTFKVNDLLGADIESSLELTSSAPVVAERPMYFDYLSKGGERWTGGHCVIGAPLFGKEYFFAEGTTRSGFDEWLTLQNPGNAAINVHAVYQLGTGAVIEADYPVGSASRYTIYVPGEVGPEQDVSVYLSSADDFLAERPMYFDYTGGGVSWTGGHCVIGPSMLSAQWFFAEGYTGSGFVEWLCIQNPGLFEAQVNIVYYPESGTPILKTHSVPANSRYTVNVNEDAGEGLSISAEVLSDYAVVVERPMYFDYAGGGGSWTGGHDVVGYQP